jgi:DNA-binding MarR family transcriptional regulator
MASSFSEQANDEFFTLWALIAQAKDALLAARQREYNRFHIKNERRAVLFSIQINGGQSTPSEIARFLFRKINSVSEMLKRMEKQGLIKRHKVPGKTRVVIKLTDKGHRVFDQSLNNEMDKKILSVLSKKEREQLRSYLFTIRKQALRELGIPEWSVVFPPPPGHLNDGKKVRLKLSRSNPST